MAGISVSVDDDWNDPAPTWTRLDLDYNVQAWTIDRGRPHEMSRTDTGTASVELVDRNGDFDPTNLGGAYYALEPGAQAKIELQNADTAAWSTLFRGFISTIRWTPYRSLEHANVTLELVDGFAVLAAMEMAADGTFGDSVEDGDIIFRENDDLDAVKTRIANVLDQAGWPGVLRSVFTGNIGLQRTVYAPRSTVLSVIQDAADAEFPDQANVYISGPREQRFTEGGTPDEAPPGSLTFHGRYARFNPEGVQYDIQTWQLGDDANAAADPTDTVRISPPLVASFDDTTLYTSGYATPMDPGGDLTNADYAGQYVTDPAAASARGLRTWSAENLLTRNGDPTTTALEETKQFADYVVGSYASPKIRVGQLTIKSRRPDSAGGEAVWALLCGIEISDIVHLTTTHGGGGGFDTDFFVEGIHYQARPGGALTDVDPARPLPYVELTLDVSPRSYYASFS